MTSHPSWGKKNWIRRKAFWGNMHSWGKTTPRCLLWVFVKQLEKIRQGRIGVTHNQCRSVRLARLRGVRMQESDIQLDHWPDFNITLSRILVKSLAWYSQNRLQNCHIIRNIILTEKNLSRPTSQSKGGLRQNSLIFFSWGLIFN